MGVVGEDVGSGLGLLGAGASGSWSGLRRRRRGRRLRGREVGELDGMGVVGEGRLRSLGCSAPASGSWSSPRRRRGRRLERLRRRARAWASSAKVGSRRLRELGAGVGLVVGLGVVGAAVGSEDVEVGELDGMGVVGEDAGSTCSAGCSAPASGSWSSASARRRLRGRPK